MVKNPHLVPEKTDSEYIITTLHKQIVFLKLKWI